MRLGSVSSFCGCSGAHRRDQNHRLGTQASSSSLFSCASDSKVVGTLSCLICFSCPSQIKHYRMKCPLSEQMHTSAIPCSKLHDKTASYTYTRCKHIVIFSSTFHLSRLASFKHVVLTHPKVFVLIYGPKAMVSIRALSMSRDSKQCLRVYLYMGPGQWFRLCLCTVLNPKALVPSLPMYHPKAMASSILYLVNKELFRTCLHTEPKAWCRVYPYIIPKHVLDVKQFLQIPRGSFLRTLIIYTSSGLHTRCKNI